MKKRLAIITTHPIQYYAPIFKALADSDRVHPRVFYTWSQTEQGEVHDAGFEKKFKWDVPLLTGYEYEFVNNVANRPSSDHFFGVKNPALCNTIMQWRPDCVLVYGWNLFSHLRALKYFAGRVPIFFRGDSTLLDDRSPLRLRARRIFLRWVYRSIDLAISVGQNNRDYYSWCGVPENRIAFAPHSIDNKRFADTEGNAERQALEWRKQLGIDPEALTIVFAGKLVPKKSPELLLEAFVRASVPAHLIVVGNGPLENQLRQLAANRSDIHFLPFQNQSGMPAVYRLGDVFVLPSSGPGETWGLALNEAMASGRAVVASSKVGGARDLIQHGVNGWTFQADNVGELSALLAEIITSGRPKLRSMGQRSLAVVQQWSTEESARKLSEAIYHHA